MDSSCSLLQEISDASQLLQAPVELLLLIPLRGGPACCGCQLWKTKGTKLLASSVLTSTISPPEAQRCLGGKGTGEESVVEEVSGNPLFSRNGIGKGVIV